MPDRLLWTSLRPFQLFSRLQAPFLVGIVAISLATLWAVEPFGEVAVLLIGIGLAVTASLLFLLPGRGWLLSGWVVVIPLLDIVAIACVRSAMLPYLPTIGMLCLFPFAWIAYRFRWPGLLAVLAGGVFIASFPFILGREPVTTPLAVLNVITLPLIATGISVGIHLGAISFRRGRSKIDRSTQQLHHALEQSRDDQLVLRSLIDTLNSAVAFYDARNQLVLANAAADHLVSAVGFRLDVPPYAGPDVLMADKQTPIPLSEQIIPRALRGEVIANHLEWLGPSGDQVAIMASSRRVHREDGLLLGTMIVAYDVTELANAIEVREQFLTTVSHELRTPLTSIIGFTDELSDTLGADAERLGVDVYLTTISRNADTLLDRVSQLLTAADKQITLAPVTTDLVTVINDTTGPITLLADRAGISLTTHSPPHLIAEVDPARIAQSLENLLTNAIKFTGRGGSITVASRSVDDDTIAITVSDTGIGMTRDEQRRIFDRFYRSQAVRNNAIQGIGVGLSIVKTIVDAHHGSITVNSQPAVGSAITLVLPRHQPR